MEYPNCTLIRVLHKAHPPPPAPPPSAPPFRAPSRPAVYHLLSPYLSSWRGHVSARCAVPSPRRGGGDDW